MIGKTFRFVVIVVGGIRVNASVDMEPAISVEERVILVMIVMTQYIFAINGMNQGMNQNVRNWKPNRMYQNLEGMWKGSQ